MVEFESADKGSLKKFGDSARHADWDGWFAAPSGKTPNTEDCPRHIVSLETLGDNCG